METVKTGVACFSKDIQVTCIVMCTLLIVVTVFTYNYFFLGCWLHYDDIMNTTCTCLCINVQFSHLFHCLFSRAICACPGALLWWNYEVPQLAQTQPEFLVKTLDTILTSDSCVTLTGKSSFICYMQVFLSYLCPWYKRKNKWFVTKYAFALLIDSIPSSFYLPNSFVSSTIMIVIINYDKMSCFGVNVRVL